LRNIQVREKIKDSGCWWVFVNYDGKRISRKVGAKWKAKKVAKEIKGRLQFPSKSRLKHTIGYKLSRTISRGIGQSLKGAKNGIHWEDPVGYSIKDLKQHLEKQFKTGMNWKNRGEWHIDHIRPVSSFYFTKPEDKEFKECWALSNLQPLWASENCSKGAKFLNLFEPPPHPAETEKPQPFEIAVNSA